MPSNVIEYCTPHDRLTKELVIPGKLIQRRHNMGHNVHSRASYIFLDKPTRNRALAFKSIADYYFMYSYSAKILNSSIIFYLYFSKQHLWPGQRCNRHKGPVSSLLSHINSWYDIYPWRHSNLKWWRLSHILQGPEGGGTGITSSVFNVVKIIIGVYYWVGILVSQGHISLNKTSQLLERQGNHRICSK